MDTRLRGRRVSLITGKAAMSAIMIPGLTPKQPMAIRQRGRGIREAIICRVCRRRRHTTGAARRIQRRVMRQRYDAYTSDDAG